MWGWAVEILVERGRGRERGGEGEGGFGSDWWYCPG